MSNLPYTVIPEQAFDRPELNELHASVRVADDAWREARARRLPDPEVRKLAGAFADVSHRFQRARYGSVRLKISVSALLR